ncbi:hypothetical protein [Arthrobacter sp. 35W]|uniref:hypothetical protein n=1 Tax=Arthrobacter sp. 35W TaxID=1132441 RepID=UPI0004084DF8|nr:hypothetical protein [Arthrobacter sp. 35W]
MTSPPAAPLTFDLTLRKPLLGWFPKPTVVVNGLGQPAQWGYRNWKLPDGGPAHVTIFLFNRLWKFGVVEFTVDAVHPGPLLYRAPWLPFLPGRLTRP